MAAATHASRVPEQSESSLLARCAAGDEAAMGSLYDRYAGPLYAVASRVTGERADAEEVVVETFAQAWHDAARFDPSRGSVGAWLTMMARSRALDLVRARVRRGRLAEAALRSDPERPPGVGIPEPDRSGDVDLFERSRRVREALADLPEPQREAIELAYYQGLSQSEIAERLRQPLGTVKTRVRLAMQQLRDALHPYYFEASP